MYDLTANSYSSLKDQAEANIAALANDNARLIDELTTARAEMASVEGKHMNDLLESGRNVRDSVASLVTYLQSCLDEQESDSGNWFSVLTDKINQHLAPLTGKAETLTLEREYQVGLEIRYSTTLNVMASSEEQAAERVDEIVANMDDPAVDGYGIDYITNWDSVTVDSYDADICEA